ncbi:winged helix-turn-helix transcriptional regulator [Paracoccus beibuensis]|uniref:winged helix-turn-helix transcriptional regulator n=1 Tax=Paracoccus beibuensis TaxID=547602 RepID=UPI00223FEBEE|nr:helix-turn-helix domain-containing protein [Paracoccus beibuensis]
MTTNGEHLRIRYDEGCLAAHALNLVGDRWAMLAVRELVFAPKRFQMLRAGLPGISASVLNGRLAQLQAVGIVRHDSRLGIYCLTPAGLGLLPVLRALCHWALTVPGHDPSRFISPSALMISMGVTLQQHPADPLRAGFDFGSEAFEMRLGVADISTVAVERPDAAFVLHGSGNDLAAAVYGGAPLADLAGRGRIRIDGDQAAAQGFVDHFSLRVPATG